MHTILGANGIIAQALSRALAGRGARIRQVSRHPRIEACQRHGARRVFFDNVHADGRVDGAMTEDMPFNPASRKGQTWHLPTSREPLEGAGFVRLACEQAGRPFGLQVAPRRMLKLMGPFVPVLRENEEMMSQFEPDDRFDSSKFESAFALRPTPCAEGIGQCLGSR